MSQTSLSQTSLSRSRRPADRRLWRKTAICGGERPSVALIPSRSDAGTKPPIPTEASLSFGRSTASGAFNTGMCGRSWRPWNLYVVGLYAPCRNGSCVSNTRLLLPMGPGPATIAEACLDTDRTRVGPLAPRFSSTAILHRIQKQCAVQAELTQSSKRSAMCGSSMQTNDTISLFTHGVRYVLRDGMGTHRTGG